MAVSVIITAYNYAQYIERAVRSALDQSLSRSQFEVMVVNDASTDKTAEILANYEDEIRVFNLEKNLGLAAARNFGLRKAKGQFVVFLDADDYIQRDLLYVEKLFLEQNNAIDAVAVDYYLVDEKGNHQEHVSVEDKPIACGIMFRKDLLFDIGLYDESFRAREEEDLRIRFLSAHSITRIPLPLYRYRRHDLNLTNDAGKMDTFADLLAKKHKS
jgi:glycosyltransferase involved in cell wall biosynthesis